jgi:hypothetical protein
LLSFGCEGPVQSITIWVDHDAADHRLCRLLELIQAPVDEPVLQRRHHGQVDDRQRAGDKARQRERELETDCPKAIHVSRKR